ncbi:metallophosphoesterase [Rubrimonas cliftonensis]|uniref:Calcineurin-like phosphoesterase domain-containing protein n=1 Tax=Rubrimonas cliftonensis TaxID=89524 RepID=A0A1H3VN04_9RHOB|nr:metallophosphoesterase [Rubrimonas cliftonensis]SDZ76166.1 hypothetical protein SAMN05444370_101217 [Rubrimonas cliftonensis]
MVEPGLRLRIQRWEVRPAIWPRGLTLRIVALADLHAGGPHIPLSRIARIVEAANALEGDTGVLLGDYRASHSFVLDRTPPRRAARALARFKARAGVFAVLGNHDWWDDMAEQRDRRGRCRWWDELEDAGLAVLHNTVAPASVDGRRVWIAGLGDQLAYRPFWHVAQGRVLPAGGLDDLAQVSAATPDDGAPAILLAHEPDIFPLAPPRFAVTLAGHTHGGQVRLFGWSPIVPSAFGARYAYGHIREDGRDLMVSAGLGCSIAPVRLGMPPEITVIDLS